MTNPSAIPEKMTQSRLYFFMATAIILVGFIAYANSFQGVFLLDDHTAILWHPRVHDYHWRYLFSAASTRPVTELTFALNYQLGRENTFGYHLVNLLIHLSAALLLFDLLQMTLRKSALTVEPKQACWFAFAVSVVWIAHPLQTQSVTYIVQRGESLASLFYLGCLNFTARGAYGKVHWPWYLAALLCCLLGMASKQIAFTAPIVVLLYDRMFLASSWKELLIKRGWVYLGFLPIMAWVFSEPFLELTHMASGEVQATESKQPVDISAGFKLETISPWQYLCTQAGVILHYLRLSLWPHPLVLDYSWPVANEFSEYAIPGALVLMMLIASVIGYFYGSPLGFVGLAFFLILAPTSSIMPIQHLCVEHRMYLPLACVIIACVWLVVRLANRMIQEIKMRQIFLATLLCVCVVAFSSRTIARNLDYSSGLKVWASNLKNQPASLIALTNYTHHLVENNQIESALIYARKAVELKSNSADARLNLAAAEIKYGILLQDKTLSVKHLRSALQHLFAAERFFKQQRKNYRLSVTYSNLAAAYFKLDDFKNSLKYCLLTVKLNPKDAGSYHLMGDNLAMLKRYQESYNAFRMAAQLGLANQDLYFGWGQVCSFIGVQYKDPEILEEASKHFTKTLALNPDFTLARYHRALVSKQLGQCDLVIKDCTVLLAKHNKNTRMHQIAGKLLSECGQSNPRQ